MTIPKITPYSGGVANPDGSQTQTEFTQNMFDQLSYEAELSNELNNTVDGINDTAIQVDADATSAVQSASAAEAAASGLNYQGLWPDSGGNANKGDTYQTQVSGTPTGQYFTALQNTTVDPFGDDVNWRKTSLSKGSILEVLGKVNKGFWDENPLLESDADFVIDRETGNTFGAVNLPYQVNSSTDPDPNLLVGTELVDVSQFLTPDHLPEYTNLVYKRENGVSAFDNMVSAFSTSELSSRINTLVRTGGTTWRYEDSTGPITESNFRALNSVNVCDFSSEEATTAGDIRKAINYAISKIDLRYGNVGTGTSPVVFIPNGVYNITEAITPDADNHLAHITIEGENAILLVDPGVIAFGGIGYGTTIKGIRFIGGKKAISIKTANLDTSLISLQDLECLNQTEACISTDATSQSSNIVVERGKFYQSSTSGLVGLFPSGDKIVFNNSWVQCFSSVAFSVNGHLTLNDMIGVPGGDMVLTGGRWVDFHGGTFNSYNSRFGGEFGGAPIVYNYVNDLDVPASFPYIGRAIKITGGEATVGTTTRPDKGFIVSKDGLPALISITGVLGGVDSPLINDQQITGALLDKLTAYKNTHSTVKKTLAYTLSTNQGRNVPLSRDVQLREMLSRYFDASGTFTATLNVDSGSVSLDALSDLLSYVQIGGVVRISGRLRVDSVNSPLGAITIPLPFESTNERESTGGSVANLLITTTVSSPSYEFVGRLNAGSSDIVIYKNTSTSLEATSAQQLKTDTVITIDISYIVKR